MNKLTLGSRLLKPEAFMIAIIFVLIGGYVVVRSFAALTTTTTTTAPLQTVLNPTSGQISNWNWNARSAPLDPQGDIGQTYSNNFINNGIMAAGARVLVQSDYAVATATFTSANSNNDCYNLKVHWGGVKVDTTGKAIQVLGGQTVPVCIPAGTKADPSDDGHLTILDTKNGMEYDLYQAWAYDLTSTPQLDEVGGAAIFPIGTVNETNDLPSSTTDGCSGCWSGNAASTPLQRGLITPGDLNAAIAAGNRSLPYTLQFSIPNIPGIANSFRFPGGHNTPTGTANSLSEGWWVRLDPRINVDALSIPNWQKVIAKTLQEHGAINRDNGGAFGFYGRNPINGETAWTSVSGLSSGVSTPFASNFPWSSMQVLAAPADCNSNPTHITCTSSSGSTPKQGDLNGDNIVNIFDLSILLSHYSQTGQTSSTGDLNNDSVVNIFDLSILLSKYGT